MEDVAIEEEEDEEEEQLREEGLDAEMASFSPRNTSFTAFSTERVFPLPVYWQL